MSGKRYAKPNPAKLFQSQKPICYLNAIKLNRVTLIQMNCDFATWLNIREP